MTAPYLGGIEIMAARAIGPDSFIVDFTSSYDADYQYQVYVGRTLAGVTDNPTERSVVAQFEPSGSPEWPEHVTLLAVDLGERDTDYGADLPPRPYNRVKLTFDTTGIDPDTKLIEVCSGAGPGDSADSSNVIGTMLFDFEGEKEFITPQLAGSGEWEFEIAGRDGTFPDGNRGTALTITADVLAHPPDVLLLSDGERFSVAVTEGVLTAKVGYQE